MSDSFVISVPVWDQNSTQADFTRNFVLQCLRVTKGDFSLVIVDNASTSPETQEFLYGDAESPHDPRFHVIHNETNRGYGAGANQGIEFGLALGCEYGIVLNNDVMIGEPNWALDLLAPLKDNPKQLVGARLIDFNGATAYDGQTILPYLEGWCLAFHKDFARDVGLFDTNILNWHEDVDLCIRSVKAGYPLAQSPCFKWNNKPPWDMVRGSIFHAYGTTGYTNYPMQKVGEITEQSRRYVMAKHGYGDNLP